MSSTFRMLRQVQFAETDLAGVLHFANYFRFMEEAEHAFWRSLGMSVLAGDAAGHISWPRIKAECEYHAPARFEDQLELEVRLVHVGGRSLRFEIVFRRGEQRLAVGRVATVCCEVTPGGRFRTITIPREVRNKLEPCLLPPGAG